MVAVEGVPQPPAASDVKPLDSPALRPAQANDRGTLAPRGRSEGSLWTAYRCTALAPQSSTRYLRRAGAPSNCRGDVTGRERPLRRLLSGGRRFFAALLR